MQRSLDRLKAVSRSDVAVVSLGQVFQQVVTMALGVAIARILGADGYGTINLLRAIVAGFATVAPLGLDVALLKYCGRHHVDSADVLATVRRLRQVALGLNLAVAAIVGIGFGGLLERHVFQLPDFQRLLVLTLLGLPAAAEIGITNAIYKARGRPGTFALLTLYLQPAARVVLVGIVVLISPSVLAMVVINTIQPLVSLIGFAFAERAHRRRLPPEPPAGTSWSEVGNVLRESGWMALNLLAYAMMRFIDITMLGGFVSASEVGAYAALGTVSQIVQVYPISASQTLGPRIARLYHEGDLAGIRRAFGDYIQTASIVASFIFAGIAGFGDELDLVFGPSFHFQPEVCLMVPLGHLISATLAPTGFALSMTGRHKAELGILSAGCVLLVGLCLVLIPRFGPVGAAAAVALSFVVLQLVRFGYVAKVLGFVPGSPRDLLPPVVGLALAYGARWGVDALGPRTLPLLILGCLLYAALFAAACLLVLFTPALRRRVLKAVGAR